MQALLKSNVFLNFVFRLFELIWNRTFPGTAMPRKVRFLTFRTWCVVLVDTIGQQKMPRMKGLVGWTLHDVVSIKASKQGFFCWTPHDLFITFLFQIDRGHGMLLFFPSVRAFNFNANRVKQYQNFPAILSDLSRAYAYSIQTVHISKREFHNSLGLAFATSRRQERQIVL